MMWSVLMNAKEVKIGTQFSELIAVKIRHVSFTYTTEQILLFQSVRRRVIAIPYKYKWKNKLNFCISVKLFTTA